MEFEVPPKKRPPTRFELMMAADKLSRREYAHTDEAKRLEREELDPNDFHGD
jgi:hypothetical protein